MTKQDATTEAWRVRKAQLTHARIADVGMRLFLEAGFDQTTVDAIAAASDISRRTFFHYFESKEAVVDTWADELNDSVRSDIAAQPQGTSPWQAIRQALSELAVRFETTEARAIDELMASTTTLQLRKQASYARQEQVVYVALTQKYGEHHERQLRLVAMVAVGCLRVAMERWRAADRPRAPLAYVEEAFDSVRDSIAH
jgi:AcrR family transcriptional regulator